jgi:hypothetical protein
VILIYCTDIISSNEHALLKIRHEDKEIISLHDFGL